MKMLFFRDQSREGSVDDQAPRGQFVPCALPDHRNPARRYLARLSPGSRRTQQAALDRIAGLVTGDTATAMDMPWHLLDAEHTAAIRATLRGQYAPTTT